LSAERIKELLEEELELYRSLRELARRQCRFIESADTDGLIPVLGRKQEILRAIGAVEAELAPFKARWNELIDALDASAKEKLAAAVAEVQGVLGEIVELEKAGLAALEGVYGQAAKEMKKIQQLGGAVKAYSKKQDGHDVETGSFDRKQ